MKFLYLVEWNFTGYSGVERKIISQVKVWKKMGHNPYLVIIGKTHKSIYKQWKDSDIEFWTVPSNSLFKRLYLDQIIKQVLFLFVFIKFFFKKIDFVLYRQSSLSLAPIFLLKHKLILDVNSNDLEDKTKKYGRLLQKIIKSYNNLLFNHSFAYLFVTFELKKYFENKYNIDSTKCFVVGNGYYDEKYDQKFLEKYFNEKHTKQPSKKTLIFIGSGSSHHYWHGVDKLILLAKELEDYHFILIQENAKYDFQLPKNIEIYDKVTSEQLPDLYMKSDVGIGSLALHRINLYEASPLKIAEYVFWGLPVVTAYKDINLHNLDFNLELPNEENNINSFNIERIKKFLEKNSSRILTDDERKIVSMEYLEEKRMSSIFNLLKFIYGQ